MQYWRKQYETGDGYNCNYDYADGYYFGYSFGFSPAMLVTGVKLEEVVLNAILV